MVQEGFGGPRDCVENRRSGEGEWESLEKRDEGAREEEGFAYPL